jgi:hypothetical protein
LRKEDEVARELQHQCHAIVEKRRMAPPSACSETNEVLEL